MKYRWKLFLGLRRNNEGYFACYTYKKDVGYVYEGEHYSVEAAIKYYKPYLMLLNECFPKGRSLLGYKIYSRLNF